MTEGVFRGHTIQPPKETKESNPDVIIESATFTFEGERYRIQRIPDEQA